MGVQNDILEALLKLASDCEQTAEEFYRDYGSEAKHAWLSAARRVRQIALDLKAAPTA